MLATRTVCCSALLLGSARVAAERRRRCTAVVVEDPYIELHTGPGRGYPGSFTSSSAARAIDVLHRRTDWFKVRTDRGREGWVNRTQLERTLTPDGEHVRFAGPAPGIPARASLGDGRRHGDFGGAS